MCACQQLSYVLLFGCIEPWRHTNHREKPLKRSEFNMFFATGYHSRYSKTQRAMRRHRKANSRSAKLAKSLYVTQCSISETCLTHAWSYMWHKHAIGLNGRIARADGAAARYPDLTSHRRESYEEPLSPSVSQHSPFRCSPQVCLEIITLKTRSVRLPLHIFFCRGGTQAPWGTGSR